MVLPTIGPLLVCIVSVTFILALAAFLVSCLCKASSDKNSNYGTEGQLKYTYAYSDVTKNGDIVENEAEHRNRSSTINRQLPDIPKENTDELLQETSVQSQRSDGSLQLYEVVTDSRSKNASLAPPTEPPAQPSTSYHIRNHSQSSVKGVISIDTSNAASNSTVGQPYAIVEIQSEHPYDKILHQAMETSGESTDNCSSPHIYAISSNIRKQGSTKSKDLPWEEPKPGEFPPPVPEKLFDVSHEQNGDEGGNHEAENEDEDEDPNVEAGAAIAGLLAAPEIPFMTDANADNDTPSEGPYTSISVREPIANLRAAELLRQQERMTHVYTTVNEEEQDQTYAEIESTNRRKGSSSAVTYTTIKEKSANCANDIPPDPPTVESLMSVTQAHSRQASDASSASHSVLSSPEASRDKAIRLLPDASDDKSSHKLSATLPAAINLDELYAKVNKNKSPDFPKVRKKGTKQGKHDTLPADPRRVLSMDCSSVDGTANLFSFSRNSTLYDAMPLSTSPGIPEMVDADDEIRGSNDAEPNYESLKKTVFEPGYETIKFECDGISDPEYETLHGNSSNISDPGYESVCKQTDRESQPPYSKIRGLNSSTSKDSDPPYEGIRDDDPPYEGIIGSQSDPPYEGIIGNQSDPPYEGIIGNQSDPPYEGIFGNQDEPPYEGIRQNDEQLTDEPPYEGIINSNDLHCSEEPPYEGLKPLFTEVKSPDDAENKSDPMYEGIKCSSPSEARTNHPALYIHSDSSEGEYERIANNVEVSDGSEPGYETVGGGLIQEPAYETLKPRKRTKVNESKLCGNDGDTMDSSSTSADQENEPQSGRLSSPDSMSNL